MTEEVKKEEVKQPTEKELWDKVAKDRAATPAADVEPKPEGGVGKDAAKDAADKDSSDPYAGLAEPTRKLIEGLDTRLKETEGRFTKVNKQLATANGTIGNLMQKFDASQAELARIAPTVAEVEARKKAEAEAAARAKAEKRKALRERLSDLPDVAELMDEVLPADAEPAAKAEPKAEPKKEPEKKNAEPAALAEDEKARLIREREMSDRHPKWIELIRSKEFKEWRDAQPEAVRALGASDDIDDADKMLTLYKKHKEDAAKVAQVEKERAERLRRGEGVQGRGSSTGDVDTGPDALWNRVKRDREKARQMG